MKVKVKIIYTIGLIQFYLFGAVVWIAGATVLIRLFDSMGLFIAFTPFAIFAPIYNLIVNGFDRTTVIWLIATVLAFLGLLLASYADEHIKNLDEV